MKPMASQSPVASKKTVLLVFWIAILVLSCLFAFELMEGRLSASRRGGDSAFYVLLAKAIAAGQGYADINIPGAPPHTQYPPLLPLVFSPFVAAFGFNILFLRAIVLAFGVASICAIRSYFGRGWAATLIALLTITNFYYIFFMRELMTEVPYAFLSFLALFSADRYLADKKRSYLVLLPVFITLAYMMRMIGVTLYAGTIAALVASALKGQERVQWKTIAFVAVSGLVVFAAWEARNAVFKDGAASTYSSIFMQADYYLEDKAGVSAGTLVERVYKNYGYYHHALPRTVIIWSGMNELLTRPQLFGLELLVLGLTFTGFLDDLLRKRGPKDFYFLFYMALLICWPVYGTGDARRYMVPIVPLVYFYCAKGAHFLAESFRRSKSTSPLNAAAVAVLLVFLVINIAEVRYMLDPSFIATRFNAVSSFVMRDFGRKIERIEPAAFEASSSYKEYGECYKRYTDTAFEMRDVLNSDDIIMARKPEVVSLITGGYALRFPFTKDKEKTGAFITAKGVDYILLDTCNPEGREYLVPYIIENSSKFSVLSSGPAGAELLKVR